ncbi:KIN10 [Symbiodinium pilosum]|uniref:KIN10 protein n=1 Tax=Symbiodinium pilosum TaxID=2952 RepID=A0A812SM83_SYMPI|nr:KIN10 [Symbiodinium pilosum]
MYSCSSLLFQTHPHWGEGCCQSPGERPHPGGWRLTELPCRGPCKNILRCPAQVADIERVAREVQLLKLIRHPHVVQLFEIIETRGQLYLIMEYASGGELFDYIVQNQRVPEPEACRFFHQIIAGVEQIHAMNVVHRDLKPENLLLDEHKCIKIVDFGLSNRFDDNQLLKTACGSPCYAPPEMVSGQSYVPQMCDLWSCGVILFAMVCGFLPFEDSNTSALYKKILAANYTPPSFITDSVKDLIAGLLTVDPAKRFTIADVRAHEWYRQIPEASVRPRDLVSGQCGLEEDVLQELKCHGFPQEYATNCLLNNKHNSVTTTYYLLASKRRRMAEHLQIRESERAREERARSPAPVPGASAMDDRPAAEPEPLRENSPGPESKVQERADVRAEAAAILREATPERKETATTAVSPPSSRASVARPGSA